MFDDEQALAAARVLVDTLGQAVELIDVDGGVVSAQAILDVLVDLYGEQNAGVEETYTLTLLNMDMSADTFAGVVVEDGRKFVRIKEESTDGVATTFFVRIAPLVVAGIYVRITQLGDTRITMAGDTRVLEAPK